jgi:hypothetical protein
MRPLLAAALLLAPAPLLANPMLVKCLPLAPESCGLTESSDTEAYLACFDPAPVAGAATGGALALAALPLRPEWPSCGEELAHARVHKACDAEDIPRLCAGVKPGNDRVMGCLRKHREELTPACRESYGAYRKAAKEAADAARHPRRRHSAVAAVRC